MEKRLPSMGGKDKVVWDGNCRKEQKWVENQPSFLLIPLGDRVLNVVMYLSSSCLLFWVLLVLTLQMPEL